MPGPGCLPDTHDDIPPPDKRAGGEDEPDSKGYVTKDGRGLSLPVKWVPQSTLKETPQASPGHAPFELVFGQRPQLLQDGWVTNLPRWDPTTYLAHLREQLDWPRGKPKGICSKPRRSRSSSTIEPHGPGSSRCTRLFPKAASQEWTGPFPVLQVCGFLTCEVRCGPRFLDTRRLHINHLKSWYNPWPEVQNVA